MNAQFQMILDQFQHLNVFEQVTFAATIVVSLGTVLGWVWCMVRSDRKDPKYPIWKDDGKLYRGSKSSPVREKIADPVGPRTFYGDPPKCEKPKVGDIFFNDNSIKRRSFFGKNGQKEYLQFLADQTDRRRVWRIPGDI